jgi:DNA replicative helicase MCM subunit Mcm2 (Cdc46/Mcm family)
MKPGDHVVITGTYLPQPVLRKGRHTTQTLLQNTVVQATEVQQLKESYTEHIITSEVCCSCSLLRTWRDSSQPKDPPEQFVE